MGVVPKGFASGVKTLASLGAAAAKLFDKRGAVRRRCVQDRVQRRNRCRWLESHAQTRSEEAAWPRKLGLGPGRAARDGLLELERRGRRRP